MELNSFLLVIAEKERDKVINAVPVGNKEYLLKPVEPEKLSNKIKQVAFGGVA
jgi:response regulator of citrate/malate metabolism